VELIEPEEAVEPLTYSTAETPAADDICNAPKKRKKTIKLFTAPSTLFFAFLGGFSMF